MHSAELKDILLWSALLNYAILCIWFVLFCCAHDRMYALHLRWFRLSVPTFDAIHYAGMAAYKIGILLLNVVPLLALCLTRA